MGKNEFSTDYVYINYLANQFISLSGFWARGKFLIVESFEEV